MHLNHTHLSPIYKELNVQRLFQQAAKRLGYPDWLFLPSILETEITYVLENYGNKKHLLLSEISHLFQNNYNTFLKEWKENDMVHVFLLCFFVCV